MQLIGRVLPHHACGPGLNPHNKKRKKGKIEAIEIHLPSMYKCLVFLKLWAGVTSYSHGQNFIFKSTLPRHTLGREELQIINLTFSW